MFTVSRGSRSGLRGGRSGEAQPPSAIRLQTDETLRLAHWRRQDRVLRRPALFGGACSWPGARLRGGELDDGDPPRLQILLIAEVLIRCHEYIEVLFRQSNKVSVLDSRPSHAAGGVALMPDQHPAERPRHTLIQEDSHEAVSSAASLLSRTRHASSRGTEGKHSMNSSRE